MQKQSFIFHLLTFAQKHAVPVVVLTAVISVVLGYFALKVELDPDVWDVLPKDTQALRLIEKYGGNMSDDYLIVAVESEELFHLGKLKALEAAIGRIEDIPLPGTSSTRKTAHCSPPTSRSINWRIIRSS